jgi:hypothetical protein
LPSTEVLLHTPHSPVIAMTLNAFPCGLAQSGGTIRRRLNAGERSAAACLPLLQQPSQPPPLR